MFQYFGDDSFNNFIQTSLKFLFLIEPAINSFPNKKEMFYDILSDVSTTIPEMIIEICDPYYMQSLFKTLLGLLMENFDEVINNGETKMLHDDAILTKIHTIVNKFGNVIIEELQIDPNSKIGINCNNCKTNLSGIFTNFVITIVQASFSLNYTLRISNLLAELVQTF